MPDPLVTVIVPGRDIAAFAPAALHSLQAQTEQRWRAILIDDGSNDATADVFASASAADSRFSVIRNAEPGGLGAARNQGLDAVDTPYLGFLDADDEFTPRALARALDTLGRTGSDFVVGAYVRTRWDGERYTPGRVQPWVASATDPEQLATTIAAHPRASANIVAWSKVSRTEFWQARRFPERVSYEDQIVAQQMYTQARRFDVIPDVLVQWRLRAEGTSITQGKAQLSVLQDYVAALRGGIRVLHDAGAHAAVAARIELILAMDLPPLQEIALSHPDPRYAATLEAFLADLTALPEFADAHPDPALAAALNW